VSTAWCSVSATCTFAIDNSLRAIAPASSFDAACITSSRPMRTRIAASPISSCTDSRSPSRLPPLSRSAMYAPAISSERRESRASACSA
jgi:hypothetical protein